MNLSKRTAPVRFLFFVVSAATVGIFAGYRLGWRDGPLIGFDVGAIVFPTSLLPVLHYSRPEQIRQHAAENTTNRPLTLTIAAAVMIAVLTAIALELSSKGKPPPAAIALVIVTLILVWLFTNTIFALHYAHIYYLEPDEPSGNKGIEFPRTSHRDYLDFIYFADCIGMTFQTSDTKITGTPVRKAATMHCILAFVFSIGIIAFTINVIGGGSGAATVPAAVR